MKREPVCLIALLCLVLPLAAQERDTLRRQLALIQPEAVRLALEDMAVRWPQTCGTVAV